MKLLHDTDNNRMLNLTIDSRSDPREYHASDHNIHRLCRRDDNHPEDDKCGSRQSDISTTEKVGEGADEWADGCERQEIGKNKPDPPIVAPNITIDVRRNSTEEVNRYLTPGP